MKKGILFIVFAGLALHLNAQSSEKNTYWQVKTDILEPIINRGFILRGDYGINRHVLEVYAGGGGRISEYDNMQYDTYEDKTNFLLGAGYQYFVSAGRQNRGFYVGADIMYANRTVASKISTESVDNIAVFTPGVMIGWLWKPFKNADFVVDLTILHPRYDFGSIAKVEFQTVPTPYEPQNLINFLGPWSIGWRF